MQLSIVDHVTEENVLALRRKGFEKRDNITRNYFARNIQFKEKESEILIFFLVLLHSRILFLSTFLMDYGL